MITLKDRLPVWLNLSLAAATGCLWFLSTPPFPFHGCAWIAMVPLMVVIDRTRSFQRAMLFCSWAGLVTNLGGFYWLLATIGLFTGASKHLSVILYLALCFYQGLIFVLFGAAVHILRHRRRVPMALVAPLAIVAAERVFPLAFPNNLAITQAWHPLVLQIADLTGPIGVSALLLMVNGAVYDLMGDLMSDLIVSRRRALLPAAVSAMIVIACLIYGEIRIHHFDAVSRSAPKLRVGIVQSNFARTQKGLLHPLQAPERLDILQEQSRELEAAGAQLIVWCETSYPYLLRRNATTLKPDPGHPIAQGFHTPVIVGAQTFDIETKKQFNSATLVDQNGTFGGIYDKTHLMNFGERVPAGETLPWLRDLMPRQVSVFTPGTSTLPLSLKMGDGKRWRIGTFICFEDTLPEAVRGIGSNHPDLLVNITNDTWFGETSEPWEHLALSVFDSIEQRSAMVRSVNSGVSAFIDANGRIVQKTYAVDPYVHPTPASHSLEALPLIEGGHTVYAHVGNLFANVCFGCLILLVVRSSGYRVLSLTAARSTVASWMYGRTSLLDSLHDPTEAGIIRLTSDKR